MHDYKGYNMVVFYLSANLNFEISDCVHVLFEQVTKKM